MKSSDFKFQDKVCVLVTHQLQYLHDVKHVIVMSKGGIKIQGSYEEIKRIENDLTKHVAERQPPNENEVDDEQKDKLNEVRKLLIIKSFNIFLFIQLFRGHK